MLTFTRRSLALLPVFAPFLSFGLARANELNSAAVTFKLPDQIQWSQPSAAGAQNATLVGDPSKVCMSRWSNGLPVTISAIRIFIPTIALSPC
jgi:hypothetical protein